MTGRRRTTRRWALGGLLFVLLTAVLAMHGAQPSPSPHALPDVLTAHLSTMEHPMTQQEQSGHDEGHARHQRPAGGADHEHPGGQVCLGLFVLISLLTLLAGGRRHRHRTDARLVRLSAHPVRGRARPPPSLAELAVLRL